MSFPIFMISFSIGILIVYLTSSPPREIMVYPTPDNVDELMYKDNADNCFKFTPSEVACPSDKNSIDKIVPQSF